ncbi:hypothetical protein CHS0354_041586 [Potamilus streckersoni]|uniref:Ribosome biogenesis protein NOP53 n=1 Tax=Potamilus streckersoni TaxID=2493646 RepID=A0AAE0VVF6_9BIVA|nr:hypothetical protein CHS0354_041586 [Potamilus streckersoni]
MMESNVGKRKRLRLSKNKKKSWRKVDISEVEEFLEDQRLQERTGGLVADKPDDQLFFVEKKVTDVPIAITRKTTRKAKAQIKLNGYESSLQIEQGKIKPPKRARQVLEKLASGKKSFTERQAEKQRKTAKKERQERLRARRKLPLATYDLWADSNNKDEKEDMHYLVVTKRRRVNVPSHLRDKPSVFNAVEVPHPGASYNPAYEDHQDLLMKAHHVEKKKQKQEKRLYNALDAQFPKAGQAPTQESILAEMSAGLLEEDEEKTNVEQEDQNQGEDDVLRLSNNPRVRREDKKDEKQRRKEKEKKEQEKLLKKEKEGRITTSTLFRIRTIKAEILRGEKQLLLKAERRRKLREEKALKTKKLGRIKYDNPDLEIKLSDELVGSLRELKPEGHLLEDRYKSLQKRNIVEPRVRAKKYRRYKRKQYEKKTHKIIQT